MNRNDISFVSLFSGAGGLDIGLEQAGLHCAYASDHDPAAASTLHANRGKLIGCGVRAFADTVIERADVRETTGSQILSRVGKSRGAVPLLVGGPPCQSWSSAGHQLGFNDPRGRLFDDFVRLAAELDVRWLLIENVRGLLTARGHDGSPGSALAHVRQRLLKAGFQTVVGLFNAADYGVAQRRVRLILIGFRAGDAPPFPAATHSKESAEGAPAWVTARQCLANIAPVGESEIIRPNDKLASQLGHLKPGQGVKSPGKSEATRPGGHWGYKQGAFLADLDQSARTVTANAQQDWILDPEFGIRRLSPRECAALQGFPANWVFEGGRSVQYRLIGNAVPPPLASAIGGRLLTHIKNFKDGPVEFRDLLPLPRRLMSAIEYTARDEMRNGASRRAAPSRRASRVSGAVIL